jgi:hypothetical protein
MLPVKTITELAHNLYRMSSNQEFLCKARNARNLTSFKTRMIPRHTSLFTLVMKFHDWQSSERCIRKLISRHCLEKTRNTNHFITWFVYFLIYFGDNHLIPRGVGGLAVFVNKINNLATQSWKKNSGLCSIENKKNNLI